MNTFDLNKYFEAFAATLSEIDTAIVFKKTINFDDFINEVDQLVGLALEQGDVVPELYVKVINLAFGELSVEHKGKYIAAYKCAVQCFNDETRIVSESDWIIQDDGKTETKNLIGKCTEGYHFGYLDGWPDSEPCWNGKSFSSVAEAEQGRFDHEIKIHKAMLKENEEGAYCSLLMSPHFLKKTEYRSDSYKNIPTLELTIAPAGWWFSPFLIKE